MKGNNGKSATIKNSRPLSALSWKARVRAVSKSSVVVIASAPSDESKVSATVCVGGLKSSGIGLYGSAWSKLRSHRMRSVLSTKAIP